MRKTAAGLAFFLAVFGLFACAGDDAPRGLEVETREMKFSPSTMRVAEGTHDIVVRNKGDLRHTVSFNGLGEEVTVNPGETKTLTISVTKGRYSYVCRILDHEGLGMRGELQVVSG